MVPSWIGVLTNTSSSAFIHFKTAVVAVGGASTDGLVEGWATRMGEDASEPKRTTHADVRRSYTCLVPSTLGLDNGYQFAFHMLAYASERPLAAQLREAVDQDVDSVVLWLGPDTDRASGTAAIATLEAWLRACGHVAPERCPLVVLSEDGLASECGAPSNAILLPTPAPDSPGFDVLKQVTKSLIIGRRTEDVVERGARPMLRVGDRVVFMPTGVLTVEALGPRSALTPPDRVNVEIDASRVLEGQSAFVRVHDDGLVYALRFPNEQQAFQMVPVQTAAELGLRSVSWPASIGLFVEALREAARQGPSRASDESIVGALFEAGNDLESLARVYPSLAAAATRSPDARRKLELVTTFLSEEMTTVLGISSSEARATILDAATPPPA